MTTKVLVVGAAGAIGAPFCHYLHEMKVAAATNEIRADDKRSMSVSVTGLDRNPRTTIPPHRLGSEIDVSDEELQSFDVVFYLVGVSSRRRCNELGEAGVREENVNRVVRFAKRMNPHQLLCFASSASVAEGASPDKPSTEDDVLPLAELDLYSGSYLMRERVLRDLLNDSQNSRTLPHMVAIRFGGVTGDACHMRRDLVHERFLAQAAGESRTLTVFHPETIRSFLPIKDSNRALYRVLQEWRQLVDPATSKFKCYYLSSFVASIEETAELVAKKTGAKLSVTRTEPPESEVPGWAVSSNKFQKDFDFTFEETDHEKLVLELVEKRNANEIIEEN